MIEILAIGLVGLVGLYVTADIADTVLGQPRNGHQFGRNRTTKIEDAIKAVIVIAFIGALLILLL